MKFIHIEFLGRTYVAGYKDGDKVQKIVNDMLKYTGMDNGRLMKDGGDVHPDKDAYILDGESEVRFMTKGRKVGPLLVPSVDLSLVSIYEECVKRGPQRDELCDIYEELIKIQLDMMMDNGIDTTEPIARLSMLVLFDCHAVGREPNKE
jgi:hypothetical protein